MKNFPPRIYVMALLGLAFTIFSCEQGASTANSADTTAAVDSVAEEPAPPPFKVAYLNSQQLLSLMPEMQDANSALEKYARGKERSFQNLTQSYQTKVQELQQKAQSGTLLQSEQEAGVKELSQMEQRIQSMQANSQTDIARKQEQLFAPILARADSVIKLVGKEEGYTFIYDSPRNSLCRYYQKYPLHGRQTPGTGSRFSGNFCEHFCSSELDSCKLSFSFWLYCLFFWHCPNPGRTGTGFTKNASTNKASLRSVHPLLAVSYKPQAAS